jgi:hypothetical protein
MERPRGVARPAPQAWIARRCAPRSTRTSPSNARPRTRTRGAAGGTKGVRCPIKSSPTLRRGRTSPSDTMYPTLTPHGFDGTKDRVACEAPAGLAHRPARKTAQAGRGPANQHSAARLQNLSRIAALPPGLPHRPVRPSEQAMRRSSESSHLPVLPVPGEGLEPSRPREGAPDFKSGAYDQFRHPGGPRVAGSYAFPGVSCSDGKRSGPLKRYSSTNARNTSSSNLGSSARRPSPL